MSVERAVLKGRVNRVPAFRARLWRGLTPYVFLAPALVFYAIFFLFSVLFSLYLSLREWDMLSPLSDAEYVGIGNYLYLFSGDKLFLPVLRNTLVFALGGLLFTVAVSLLLALLMGRSRYKAWWRTLYFLPMVTTVVAIGEIWRYLYNPQFGLLNALLRMAGLKGLGWIESPEQAMSALIAVSVWAGLGGSLLIFSAGLESIPETYYEAARIDGAGPWQEFCHITLPLLRPTLLFVLVTGFITGLQSFALVLVMTGGGPANATRVLALYMYQTAFQDLRMGRATAMVFVLFLVILAITLVQLRLFRRGGVESY